MVEFAIVASVFWLLLFAIMECSYAIFAYSYVSYSAREASRFAAVHGGGSRQPATADSVRQFVLGQTQGLDTNQLTVNTTWAPDNQAGSVVKVQVQYNLKLSIPFMPASTLPLTSTSKMVIG